MFNLLQVTKSSADQAAVDDLTTKAVAALVSNQAFLDLASPTNGQTLTQVTRLTRQTSALIRLLVGRLESTTGT